MSESKAQWFSVEALQEIRNGVEAQREWVEQSVPGLRETHARVLAAYDGYIAAGGCYADDSAPELKRHVEHERLNAQIRQAFSSWTPEARQALREVDDERRREMAAVNPQTPEEADRAWTEGMERMWAKLGVKW